MSRSCRSWLYVVVALMVPVAAGAQTMPAGAQTMAAGTQTVAPDAEAVSIAALPRPQSITKRYVPVKAPRAPLALLIDDSSVVAAAPVVAAQPVIVEEVGQRPAITALAPGRLAITVSSAQPLPAQPQERHGVGLFQNGRPLPPVRR